MLSLAALPQPTSANPKDATTTGRNKTKNNGSVNQSQRSSPGIEQEKFDLHAAPQLAFVTVIGRPSESRAKTSKRVRTQVMRDYLWKQQHGTAAKPVHSVALEPSRYKGRFKLNTWSHKARRVSGNIFEEETAGEMTSQANQEHLLPSSRGVVFSFGAGRIDPFNSFAFPLLPSSDQILRYYHTSYSMNSVSINPTSDFFARARTDPAMLHSVLHLVALHKNLRQGISGSRDGLYHGAEAFRIINERLQAKQSFTDMTIAAVAMLANKENMNGNYDLAKMHMRGLMKMIETRGGVRALEGVFLRIVTWSDLCFANVRNRGPAFAFIKSGSPQLDAFPLESFMLSTEDLFGTVGTPMVGIVDSIRRLSGDLDPENTGSVDRVKASSSIYKLEYSLLSLNSASRDSPELVNQHSFKIVPLKTAVHLYLYLVIREIPRNSKIIERMVVRLQDSLEPDLFQWWNSTVECQTWLLWILFIGCTTSYADQKVWFVREFVTITDLLGISSQKSLELHLKKVLWQGAFYAGHCSTLWDEVMLLGEAEPVFWVPN